MEPCLKPCLECPELFKEVVGHPLGLSAQAGDINRLLPSIAIGAHRDVVDEVILANIILAIDMEDDINCKIKGNIEGKIEGNMEGKNEGEMEGKIKALTAQGKLQGIVMACLPLFLMGILTLMEPEAMAPLYNTLYGWITLFVIFVMVGLGYLGISKIVNIDV